MEPDDSIFAWVAIIDRYLTILSNLFERFTRFSNFHQKQTVLLT